MPITIKELVESREFDTSPRGGSETIRLWAFGSTVETEIYTAVLAATPAVYLGFVKQSISAKPMGGGLWDVTVPYGTPEGRDNSPIADGAPPPPPGTPPPPPPPPEPTQDEELTSEISIEITGTTQHITNSIATKRAVGVALEVAPDYKGSINVTAEGVQGLDVEVPAMKYTLTRVFPYLTQRYVKAVRDVFGCVNDAPFFQFAPGEVRFVGASFSPRRNGDKADGFTGTFTFEIAKNEVNILVRPPAGGAGITVPDKDGWDYLWVAYRTETDAASLRSVERPFAAYVEQVYRRADFVKLKVKA